MKQMTTEQYFDTYGEMPQWGSSDKTEDKDARATRGFATGLATGAMKSVGELGLGIGQMGRGIQRGISQGVDAVAGTEGFGLGESPFDPERADEIRDTTLAAEQPGEGTGKFLGTLAQYMAPTSPIVRGQRMLQGAAQGLPRAAQGVGQVAARFAPEAVGTGAVGTIRSGGDLQQGATEGVLAGAGSVALRGLAQAARSTYWPALEQSVTRAFGIQGKRSGGKALQDVGNKISGLGILKKRAPETQVKLPDGTTQAFDPSNATYDTTLQAWNQIRKNIYDQYHSLARQAGDSTTIDISRSRQALEQMLDEPVTATQRTAINRLIKSVDEAFPNQNQVDILRAEKFVENLNKEAVDSFFKGTSDAVASEVNASTARAIREMLDEAITSRTGGQYQALRTQYSALKGIEDDLVRKFQQQARSTGGGLPEYVGMFASGDIISGLLSGSPMAVTRGTLLGAMAAMKRNLSSNERHLRRSFDLLDQPETSQFIQRLFGD